MSLFSGLIITFNEAHNIAACIASLKQVCDDIVVVDSGSQDDTVAIARELGATVIVQAPFLGDGPQRSLGLPHCKHSWVINLDADERLEADLVSHLQQLDTNAVKAEAIECRRRNYIGPRFTPYAGQYPDYVCRIFDRTRTDFLAVHTHSRIQARALIRIPQHITHYSYRDYEDMFNRINKYSSWQAKELLQAGKQTSHFKAVLHGLFAFTKHYVLKRGFLAGADGFAISLSKGLGSYLKYAKLLELRQSSTRG